MSNAQQVMEELRGLDLSAYPSEKINTLIQQFEKFGLIQMVLHPGKTIIRARPNLPGQRFTTRTELSYKPQQFNTTFQRASTPNQTMFYGAPIPDDVKPGEIDNARLIASCEASSLLRNKGEEGEQTITFSKWVVTQDIPLIAMCYHKDFVEKSPHTKELYDAYQEWCREYPSDFRDHSMSVTTFLGEQFAKNDITEDYDYMISAMFSEIVINKGKGGIYYPSVKVEGLGYNVAISPAFVDSSLKLVAVGECIMYKQGDQTMVDNELVCTIEDPTRPFELKSVPPENHVGRENIYARMEAASNQKMNNI